MKFETHPQVTEVLGQLERFNRSLEEQMGRAQNASFTATDETETVEVTIDGRRCLTDVHIEDGLLRMGAETVERRINEALLAAQAGASEALRAQQAQLMASLTEITGSLSNAVGLTSAKLG